MSFAFLIFLPSVEFPDFGKSFLVFPVLMSFAFLIFLPSVEFTDFGKSFLVFPVFSDLLSRKRGRSEENLFDNNCPYMV